MSANPVAEIAPLDEASALMMIAGRGNWRQYPAYAAEAARRVGATSQYALISRDGVPVAVANLRTRKLPLGLGASTLVSHGPVLLGPAECAQRDLDYAIAALARYARVTGQEIRVDVDPLWDLSGITPTLPPGVAADPTGRAYRTLVLRIDDGIEAVRGRLHSKWRNKLRQAEAAGLRTVISADPTDFFRMQGLLVELIARKGFSVDQDCAFFGRAAAAAREGERILITLVYDGAEVVSAHLGAYSGEMACYVLGATNARGREIRAANAAQWAAIEAAIGFGQTWYDLGGINPAENPDVFEFKKRMGGTEVTTAGVIVLPPSGLRAITTRSARFAWSRLRR